MKDFKELLEGFNMDKIAKGKEFEDSGFATSYMENIMGYLESKALRDWANVTDDNFGTSTKRQLKKAIGEYQKFLEMMYSAGE